MAEKVEYNLNLDLTLHPIQSILIKQYSKNVYKLIVSVTKETVVYVLNDSLYNVYFKMRTPDNRYVYTQGSIDENGKILLDVPESAAWTAGVGEAEFEIIKKDGTSRMSTCSFEVVIDASSYEEAEITGSEDFSALVDYISQAADISDEVAQAKEYRDEAVTSATTASQAAQTATTAESTVRGLQESAAASATVAVESKESAEASATTASQAAQSASEDAEAISQALQEAIALYNGPLTAKTAAEMTQTNRIYVYTGSESGYTFGNWYYYNGSTWQSGGTYNATAMDLDDTLTVEGKAADAKAVGDEIESFRSYSTNKFSNLEMTDDSIREDVTSLKEDLTNALEQGNENIELNLSISPSTRFVSQRFSLTDYTLPITFKCSNNAYSFYISFYDSNDGSTTTTWQKGSYTLEESAIPSGTVAIKLTGKADDDHVLTDTEKSYFSAEKTLFFVTEIEEIQKRLNTVYVSTVGNDGNDGTADNPLKTITKALSLNPSEILVKPGTYSERLNLSDVHGLTIAPWNYGTFAAGDDDKKIVLDGINTRPYLLTLSNCSDITLVGIKTISFTNSGIRMTDCTNIKLTNCECGDQYGTYQYGIGFELINTNADFEYCYAHDVSLDGFNIHGFGTTKFINCTAKDCGDDGISHHDACVGYISGGEYSGCGKGGIASPTYGAYINVDSAYCHGNLYGIYAVSSSSNRRSKALVNNCALKNNTNKDLYVDYADVTGWNNIYDTKTVGSNATLTELS